MTAEIDSDPGSADLGNWRSPPHSRWAFHHVSDILPTARIAFDPRTISALPIRPRTFETFRLRPPGGSDIDLATFHTLTATDAMVVLVDGEIAYEFYANGNSAHQPHILKSAGKSVLGLVVGILADRGELKVDAPVSDYLPGLAGTLYAEATLRHLLDMRVAIVLDEEQQHAYNLATNWEPVGANEKPTGLRTFFESLTGPPVRCGGPFSYISANTDLLGLVVETATGRSLATLTSDHLWAPMGAEDDGYVTLDRDGAPRPTGGLGATARDFARLGQLVVTDGVRGARTILPPDWVKDTLEGGDHEAWRKGAWGQLFAPISPNFRYRNGWYVVDDEPPLLFAMGVHGQNLFVDRQNKLVVAKLSSQADRSDVRAIGLTHWAITELRRILLPTASG